MNEMNITFAQYYQASIDDSPSSISVVIDGKEFNVPLDPANRHYAAIMQAVADGQLTIQEAVQ